MTNIEIGQTESLGVRSPYPIVLFVVGGLAIGGVSCRHVKRPFPQIIEPMMASPIKDPFDSPDWIVRDKDGRLSSDRGH
jgi:hypothetical protein